MAPVEPTLNTCQVFGWVKDSSDNPVVAGEVILSHADFAHGEHLVSGRRVTVLTDSVGFFDFPAVIETASVALAPYEFIVDGRRYTGIQIPDQASCALAELIPLDQVADSLTASALASLGELEQGRILSRETAFTFATTSPAAVVSLKAGDIVEADLVIETAFDDAAATLEIGTVATPGAIMPAADNDPAAVNTYRTGEPFVVVADVDLVLTITPGTSTVGVGRALVSIRRA